MNQPEHQSLVIQRMLDEKPLLKGVVVSAKDFFHRALTDTTTPIAHIIQQTNHWKEVVITTDLKEIEQSEIPEENNYSHQEVIALDKQLTDRFHHSIDTIVKKYPRYMDQIRYIHFSNMNGNEDVLLYPSQTRRLLNEGVESIAGQIRTIQTGFGDFRFNGPSVEHVHFLLDQYTQKVESLLPHVSPEQIYEFVSFAQYYFALIHPFYERCGRTSEELMYILFAQTHKEMTRYISKTGWRESPLATERMDLLNRYAEDFNRRIARCLGVSEENIVKTPEVYMAFTKKYYPEESVSVYPGDGGNIPFYYSHPIQPVIDSYYFAMEALLYDEIASFDLKNTPPHIKALGEHLEVRGHRHYTFQKENRGELGATIDPTVTPDQS